jgi:hypothetical protein
VKTVHCTSIIHLTVLQQHQHIPTRARNPKGHGRRRLVRHHPKRMVRCMAIIINIRRAQILFKDSTEMHYKENVPLGQRS